jgi:CheY-like chemotaxis protein
VNENRLTIHSPAAQHGQPSADFLPPSSPQTEILPPARVLLAEDYRQLAKLMERALAQAGYEVTVVHDGRAAIDRLGANSVDLAILDLDLPKLGGLEVCHFLRCQPQLQRLRVILCTGRNGANDHARARELGINAFISKPFGLPEFLQSVREVLALAN